MGVAALFRRWLWLWIVGEAVLLAATIGGMLWARQWALAELTKPASTAAWEEWREDVRAQQDRPAPVQRRVPKSPEPPALVLLRDYFGVALTGAVVFASVLYWVMAWLVCGMLGATSDRPAS